MLCLRNILILLFAGLFVTSARVDTVAQCRLEGPFNILDQRSYELSLNVEGLLMDDLATNQSLCGVNIEFQHSSIGDLQLKLTSPSGQSIQLIGDDVPGTNTDFSVWRIMFVPSSTTAMPDAGHRTKWSNDDLWPIGGSFSGSYYPFLGNLEDFNMGSANGKWTITVADENEFDVGLIGAIELIFCEPTGINCSYCVLNAGIFSVENYTFCDLADVDIQMTPIYPGSASSSSATRYAYVWFLNDSLLSIRQDSSLPILDYGNYTICGLNYQLIDSTMLGFPGSGVSQDSFQNWYQNLDTFCIDMSSTCMQVNIYEPNAIAEEYLYFCHGDTAHFLNFEFIEDTDFDYVLRDVNGCDSGILLKVREVHFTHVLDQEKEINCTNDSIWMGINWTYETTDANITYAWSTLNGNIIGRRDSSYILIDMAGDYTLDVQWEQCDTTIIFAPEIDVSMPNNLLRKSSDLSCSLDSILLTSAFDLGFELEWSSAMTPFLSADDSLYIRSPGTYYLKTIAANGCFDLDSVIVTADTTKAQLMLFGDTLDCANPSNEIYFTSDLEGNYYWSDAIGPLFSDSTLSVNEPGWYWLDFTLPNGCHQRDSIFVPQKEDVPFWESIQLGLINCLDSTAEVQVEIGNAYDSLLYTYGSDRMPTAPIFTIQGVDTLQLEVIKGYCKIDTNIYWSSFEAADGFDLLIRSIGCNQIAVHEIQTDDPAAEVVWNFNGTSINQQDSFVQTGFGAVTVEVINSNGCALDSTFTPPLDTMGPRFSVVVQAGNMCSGDSLLLSVDSLNTYEHITWSSNGMVLGTEPNLTVFNSMPILVEVENLHSGCITQQIFNADLSGSLPMISAVQIDTAICPGESSVLRSLQIDGGTAPYELSIDGEIIVDWTELDFNLTSGIHVLEVRDSIGCAQQMMLEIPDIIDRNIQILGPTEVVAGQTENYSYSTSFKLPSDQIYWFLEGTEVDRISDTISLSIYQTSNLLVRLVDSNGCTYEDNIRINIQALDFYIPNAFSPNDDGVNEYIGLYTQNVIPIDYFKIFDRWGNKVFHAEKGSSDELFMRWDGKFKDEDMPVGFYTYVLKFTSDGRANTYQGGFYLIR